MSIIIITFFSSYLSLLESMTESHNYLNNKGFTVYLTIIVFNYLLILFTRKYMYNTTNKLILFIISLLYIFSISSSSLAEEIETLTIPIEEEIFPYEITLIEKNSKPTHAIIQIINDTTNEKKEYLLPGKKEIFLSKGKYTAIINGGSRRIANNINFNISDNSPKKNIITIKPFVYIEPTGWIMIDTYFNPPAPVSKSSLEALAKALELKAIYTPLNNVLNKNNDFKIFHTRNNALLAPSNTFLHKEFGEVISFNSKKAEASAYNPTILTNTIYSLLENLKDLNNLTALSPVIFYKSKSKIIKKYSEEFIFDTITGPLYDFILLNDFSSSVKIWHTLLNLGYRIPAVYIGGNNFYKTNTYPTTKMYAKVARKKYNQNFIHDILKNGQSILSNGPFIRFFAESTGSKEEDHKTGQDNTDWINGHSLKIGGLGFTSDNFRNIYAEAYSSSNSDDKIESIELIYNGKIIEKKNSENNKNKAINVTWKVLLNKPGWIQLRYHSKNNKYHAITNPIYLIDYNTKLPNPALAKTEIQVVDAKTNKPIEARIFVENFGINIDKIDIFKHPLVIQTPATANIKVEANGYKSMTKNIYLEGGGAKYIKILDKKKLMPKALINPVTYSYLKKALLNSKLIFKLKHK